MIRGADEAAKHARQVARDGKAAVKAAVFKIVRSGAKAAKSFLTRKRTGLLGKAIGATVKVKGELVVGTVRPRRGFRVVLGAATAGRKVKFATAKGKLSGAGLKSGDVLDPVKYARFIEGGHKKGKGKSAAPAYPFIKPARELSAKEAPIVLTTELNNTIRALT